jgi:hypothetical protein
LGCWLKISAATSPNIFAVRSYRWITSEVILTPESAANAIINATPIACKRINQMSRVLLKTRGGRRGSGMGSLLEALWGFYTNQALSKVDPESYAYELGWFSDHG